MAIDQYLQIDGIKGESTDSKHKDWIEILSYSMAGAAHAAGAATAEKKTASGPGEIVITKPIDISSPKLQELCSSGKHISKVAIEAARPAAGQPEKIEMSDVTLTKAGSAASPHDKNTQPTESITLNYGTIKWTYTQQK